MKAASKRDISKITKLDPTLLRGLIDTQRPLKEFNGYEKTVATKTSVVYVELSGNYQGDSPKRKYGTLLEYDWMFLGFPPNDPKYLSELLRCMNHGFAVDVGVTGSRKERAFDGGPVLHIEWVSVRGPFVKF